MELLYRILEVFLIVIFVIIRNALLSDIFFRLIRLHLMILPCL